MKCPSCGAECGGKFCTNCGTALSAENIGAQDVTVQNASAQPEAQNYVQSGAAQPTEQNPNRNDGSFGQGQNPNFRANNPYQAVGPADRQRQYSAQYNGYYTPAQGDGSRTNFGQQFTNNPNAPRYTTRFQGQPVNKAGNKTAVIIACVFGAIMLAGMILSAVFGWIVISRVIEKADPDFFEEIFNDDSQDSRNYYQSYDSVTDSDDRVEGMTFGCEYFSSDAVFFV